MRGIGTFLVIMGVGSFVLNFLNMEFKLLMWVDLWGAAVGTAIRIGLIVVGAVLMFAGGKKSSS